MKLNHVLKVDGYLRKYDDSVVPEIDDYVITNSEGVDYLSLTLPRISYASPPTAVEHITISYDGHRLEVMGVANSRPVFLMQLSDEAMRQLTTRWLTKL